MNKTLIVLGVAFVILIGILLIPKHRQESASIPITIIDSVTKNDVGEITLAQPEYKNNDLSVSFVDSSKSENVLDIELKSHNSINEIKQVGIGWQVVMWYDINSVYFLKDALGTPEFIDMRTGKIVERDWNYVVWSNETYEDPIIECQGMTTQNGTAYNECSQTGTQSKTREVWLPYNSLNMPIGNTRIGIEVEVLPHDLIDGIWKIGGQRIEKHAVWTASLNSNIVAWYNFNEGSGTNIDDQVGHNKNGTTINSPVWVNGTFNSKGLNFSGSSQQYVNFTATDQFNVSGGGNLSISVWIYPNSSSGIKVIASKGGNWYLRQNGLKLDFVMADTGDFAYHNVWETTNNVLNTGKWQHIVFSYNGTRDYCESSAFFSVNGSVVSMTNTSGHIPCLNTTNQAGNFRIGELQDNVGLDFDGGIDEFGIWNKSLIPSEAVSLYNGGTGCTYQSCGIGIASIILSPPDTYNSTVNNVNFRINITDASFSGIKNVSLLINGTVNSTNSSGLRGMYNFSVNLGDGNYNWSAIVYDTSNNSYAPSNGTFTFLIAPFLLNSIAYNSTTYETALETYIANVSTRNNVTPSSSNLIWNGTVYPAAINSDGANFLLSRNLIINNTNSTTAFSLFNFTLNIGGLSYATNVYNQTINQTNLTVCNSPPLNVSFLNITFKDENSLTSINMSVPSIEFVYWLGDGTVNKILTYTNTNNNYNYTFCGVPINRNLNVQPTIQYKRVSDYPQRIWQPSTQVYNSTMTTQVLYGLSTTDGIYVTYQVIDAVGNQLSGVSVTVTRVIGSTTVTVGAGTTDAAGIVTFWVNPDALHTVSFSKSSYTTLTINQFPTQPTYTITLGSSISGGLTDYTRGVTYQIRLPLGTTLQGNTIYNFNLTLASIVFNLTSYGFNLYGDNNLVNANSSTSSTGGTISVNQNTGNFSHMVINYYWVINGTTTSATSGGWLIYTFNDSNYSINYFFTDLKTYAKQGIFGLDNDSLNLIIFAVIFLSVGIMSYKFGLTSPAAISGIVFALVFFFDVGLGMISIGKGVAHFTTIFIGLIMLFFIFREVTT